MTRFGGRTIQADGIYECDKTDYYRIVKEGSEYALTVVVKRMDGSFYTRGLVVDYSTAKKNLVAYLKNRYNHVTQL